MNKQINSLYRKYRPKTFDEVVAQEHVTKTLQNQITGGKVNHAYLFCGTRGTGKTTAAKVFAAAVNENKGNDVDIFEIDAASNNSVDDVRDLIEKTKYPPTLGKYKIYIIDEVHMFSASAFNAFLKTLEEPPSHVIFILCTTEVHKLPQTIQSRVLRFDFRPIATEALENVITKVFTAEGIKSGPEAIKQIARAGSGSLRDSLSIAETVVGYCGGALVKPADVAVVLGTVDKTLLQELARNILVKDVRKVFDINTKIFASTGNVNLLVRDILTILKELFIEKPDQNISKVYKIFAECELSIKTAIDTRLVFEGCCILAMN